MVSTTQYQTSNINHKLQLIDNLSCTEKGKLLLNGKDEVISIRERQFLRLLNNNDSTSRRACSRILTKIPLQALIDSGLIISTQSSENISDSEANNIRETLDLIPQTDMIIKLNKSDDGIIATASTQSLNSDNTVKQKCNFNNKSVERSVTPPPSALLQVLAGTYLT